MEYTEIAAKKPKRHSSEKPQRNFGDGRQAMVKNFGRNMVGRKIIAASSFCHTTSFCQEFRHSAWRCRILLRMSDLLVLHFGITIFEVFAPVNLSSIARSPEHTAAHSTN